MNIVCRQRLGDDYISQEGGHRKRTKGFQSHSLIHNSIFISELAINY